jgi:hypothetical protein
MTAQEYLEDLQAVYRWYQYLLDILHKRRDLLTDSRRLIDELLTNTEVDAPTDDTFHYGHELSKTIVDRMAKDRPKEWRERYVADLDAYLAGTRPEVGWALKTHNEFLGVYALNSTNLDIAVGELETVSFNASAIPVPGQVNSWVIALNRGSSAIVYEVARALVGTFSMNDGKAPVTNTLTIQEAGQIIHDRMNHYIHLGVPYGNDYDISLAQIALASSVTTMAERFVYAHEMSHIFLGHLNGAPLQALPGDCSGVEQITHDSDQEHQADIIAWQLLTSVFVKSMSDLQMAFAGASLFLQVADLLEHAEDLTAIGTHPPALERRAFLYESARRTANEAGVSFEQIAVIEQAMSHQLDRVLQETPPLPDGCPLEELLDKSSRVIPDYTTFHQEVLVLLSFSAPSKLCRKLGRALGKAEKELRELGIDINKAPDEGALPLNQALLEAARLPFNTLKLVRGMMMIYLIPEINHLIERYRDEYLKEVI